MGNKSTNETPGMGGVPRTPETKHTGRIGAVVKRHQTGQHSRNCHAWDNDYQGYVCRYSWEPHGPKAIELLTFGPRRTMALLDALSAGSGQQPTHNRDEKRAE